jgi:hypothetical protein
VRTFPARPRLTLVAREGDPAPAVAFVFVTDLGPGPTTALAAVMESRLGSAGFDLDVRVDRDDFRVRVTLDGSSQTAGQVARLFDAVTAAMARPLTAGAAPEITLATQRLQALRRRPLDAPELSAATACTGALGIAPGEGLPDLATESAVRDLEVGRRAALHAENVAVAAVGPAAFGTTVAETLARSSGWPPPAPGSAPPAASVRPEQTGLYTAPDLDRRGARITIAARVPDPLTAAAAAERLGAPDSPLVARLRLLPEGWRVVQVAGVARPRGGCVGLVLETAQRSPALSGEPGAALAVAVARREVAAELLAGATPAVAARQILTATDPREAASRAAWWSLAGPDPGASLRWTTALGLPVRDPEAATHPAAEARFQAEIDRASATTAGAERRLAAERGQGELWLMLASPCGVAEEDLGEPGVGALATLAALEARRRADGVTLEPWITSDGIGVLAHAPLRDEREEPADLARRVADAAARAFTATAPPPDAYAAARAAALDHLDRTAGPRGAALAALAAAVSPDHPSWIEPFGLWSKIANASAEGIRLRALALARGPLRVAVVANADAAQASAAADAVDRWLAPLGAPRTCRAQTPSAIRPGHYETRLPDGAPLAQALLAAPIPPPRAPGRDLAEITAAALEGEGGGAPGLLAASLVDATASVRLRGGARAPVLVVDVRAPTDGLAAATAEVKALLLRLPTSVTEADLTRAAAAWERREREAQADPRRRLTDLWAGGAGGRTADGPVSSPSKPLGPGPAGRPSISSGESPRPSLSAWRAFLSATLREAALVVVEARPQ